MLKTILFPKIRSVLLIPAFSLLVLTWLVFPNGARALDNFLVYPNFPWKGMKVEFTTKGNFLLRGHTDFEPLIYPQSVDNPVLNVIQRRDINLCTAGTVNYLDLSGKVVLTIPGPAADFKDAYVDIGVYHYPPGDVDGEILKRFTRSLTNAEYQPIIEIPFNLSGDNSQGYPPGFSIILQVCRWRDPSHTTTECHTQDLNAVDIVFSDDPQNCFRIGSVNPAEQQKSVDFDQPGIQVEFTTPVDQNTVTSETFYVFYWDRDGRKAKVNGSISFSQDNTKVFFQPDEPLLDGVYYVAEVLGKTDAQGFGRSAWIKSAGGADLKRGKTWDFWTMPDLTDKIVVVPVQAVEGQVLVKGKDTVLKVFLRWDKKPQVAPEWQLKTLEADVLLSWWENNFGRIERWSAPGVGTSWKPEFQGKDDKRATWIRKREYQTFTDPVKWYSKDEKYHGLDSVTCNGIIPREEGVVTFEAEVLPLGQNPIAGVRPRTFSSSKESRSVKATRGFTYIFIPFWVGDWAATNLVVPCPPGSGAGTKCVNIEAVVSKNISNLLALFPVDPAEVFINSGFSSKAALFDGTFAALNPNQASNADNLWLLKILNRWALAAGTNQIYVGLFPQDWLRLGGNTYPESRIGFDYYRNAIQLGHGARDPILAHETGHILPETNWLDFADPMPDGEGFDARNLGDYRSTVRNLSGAPDLLPIYPLMYQDIQGHTQFEYWVAPSEYRQLYQSRLMSPGGRNADLRAGEPLLLISGSVDTATGTISVDPCYQLEPGETWTPGAGEYSLRFLDGGGNTLADYSFSLTEAVNGRADFMLKVHYPAGTARVQITHSGSPVQEIIPTANAPQVTVTAPTAGGLWSGVQTISWTGSDVDPGTTLNYLLSISTDNRQSWRTLGLDLTAPSLSYDTRDVLNSDTCFLRVAATDGINTTVREAGPFAIRNAPRLTSKTPGKDQTGVKQETAIFIGFSEPVNPATVNGNTFYLKDASNNTIPGSISYVPGSREATFRPTSPLLFASPYTVHVTTGIQNAAGTPLEAGDTWSFTTEADIYPPQVLRYSPAAGDSKVSVNAALIWVRFDQPMNPATLTAQTVTLKTEQGVAVEGAIEYNPADYTLVFRPIANLAAETRYVVTLDPAIADSSGHILGAPFRWVFKTGTASQYTPWVQFTKNFRDYLWDQNGDGQWDYLVVEADLAILFPGTYSLEGWLLDKNGLAVAQAKTGNVNLPAGLHTQAFYFSRQDILNHGGEGPYYFGDAFIQDVLYPASLDALTTPYQTLFTNYTADSELLLFAFPDPGVHNRPLTFYASVDNQGSSNADGVVLTATLPPTVDFVSATSGQGGCSHNGGTVTCSIGALGSRQSNLVSIQVMPREKGWIQFQASVTSVQDSYVANNDRQLSLEIGAGNNILYLPLMVRP